MQIIDKIDIDKWKCFLNKQNNESVFLLPEMELFFNANKNSKACSTFVMRNGEVLGMALGEISRQNWDFIGISKKTILYSSPLHSGSMDVLDLLLQGIKKEAGGLFIEIRNTKMLSEEEKKIYLKNGYLFRDHLDAKISLNDKQQVWNRFEKDKKKGIRKASEKYGLQFIEKSNEEGIDNFYLLTRSLYREKRHPFKPKSYFSNFLANMGGKVRFFFCYFEGKPIATQMALFYKKTITAMYTATSFKHQEKKAGDFLIWNLINIGFAEGFSLFDFGGAGDPNKYYGPREYKIRFGCELKNVGRCIYPRNMLYPLADNVYRQFLR